MFVCAQIFGKPLSIVEVDASAHISDNASPLANSILACVYDALVFDFTTLRHFIRGDVKRCANGGICATHADMNLD
jgi:hypothetical protein